jgi:septum site-determining protein MinC
MSSSAASTQTASSIEAVTADVSDGDTGAVDASSAKPAAVLKGGPRGLEFAIDGRASVDAIAAALCTRLAEAPAFFRGSSVRVRVDDGPLPAGCLARLDDIATRFGLHIIEVGASRDTAASRATKVASVESTSTAVAEPAAVAPPLLDVVSDAQPSTVASVLTAEPSPSLPGDIGEQLAPGDTRIVVGPVRSGVILEHAGNLVVVGDVNPGAEVRSERNIIVLGRLRGIAHAGIGRNFGFILALKLEPQQLRIARQVARAGDAEGPVAAAEIAYVTSNKIVVERYAGKLPLGLANSM